MRFQPLEYHLQPLRCQLLIRTKHNYVIQLTQEAQENLITKDGHHYPCECGRAVAIDLVAVCCTHIAQT